MLNSRRGDRMSECKHGLRQGCVYCHAPTTAPAARRLGEKKRTKASRLSDQMNDRITSLNRRLRQLRGQ
jgi:hypothetical protein